MARADRFGRNESSALPIPPGEAKGIACNRRNVRESTWYDERLRFPVPFKCYGEKHSSRKAGMRQTRIKIIV